MSESAVTVVIPTYNAGAFIGETLVSVYRQTLLPAEVIVVDDGSTDQTTTEVERVSRSAPCPTRLVRRRQSSGGPAVPLNEGMRLVRTEWVALLDHDDRMLPEKLSRQMQALHELDGTLCFSDFAFLFAADGTVHEGMRAARRSLFITASDAEIAHVPVTAGKYFVEQLFDPGVIQSCSNLLFRKSLYDRFGPFDHKLAALADYIFKLNVASDARVVFVPDVLFEKRVHGSNLFTRVFCDATLRTIRRQGVTAAKKHRQLVRENGDLFDQLRKRLIVDAFVARKVGHYRESWQLYLFALQIAGPSRELMRHLLRWPVGVCCDQWTGATRKKTSTEQLAQAKA